MLPKEETHIGKYGMLRKTYLKKLPERNVRKLDAIWQN
jgi:hypothetical protein